MSRPLVTIFLATALMSMLSACFYSRTTRPATTTEVARVYERCDINGEHCVRITCDRDADRCWRESQYASSDYYHHNGHWLCDADGDHCRYEYDR
jgi:hypothetical protein